MSNFKQPTLRDDKWLKYIRTEMHCLYTGSPHPDPAHMSRFSGTSGTARKAFDNSVLPISHAIHAQMHSVGEVETLKMYFPKLSDYSVMFFMRAGAEKLYRMYKDDTLPENFFMR